MQLSSGIEGQVLRHRDAYMAGLREMLRQLERDKIFDFTTVSARVASYRTGFIEKVSKMPASEDPDRGVTDSEDDSDSDDSI